MEVYIDGLIYSMQKRGGITRYADELISGLDRKNISTHVLLHQTPQNQPPRGENISIDTVNDTFQIDYSRKINKYLFYPYDLANSKKYFRKISRGVMHSTYYTAYPGLRIPQIVSVYDLAQERLPHFDKLTDKLLVHKKKRAIRSADALICISEQVARDLGELYEIDNKKIFVVPLAVDENFLNHQVGGEAGFLADKKITAPYILFVGNRSLYKNFDKFIRAFAAWKGNSGYSAVLVGGGQLKSEESGLIEELGIREKVISFGAVTEAELISFYASAKAFVYPSLYEGFGMPLLEAMACGTTVLASDIPVFREVGGEVPIYFDPESTQSMAGSFDRLQDNQQERHRAGIGQAKKFSWENNINKTIEIYKKFAL